MTSDTPITLTIAGSDSGGGAGIQADIKAISATGGYACSVITALTAQNTLGVSGIYGVPPDFIRQQIDAVFSDLDIKAVKIGMLGDAPTIDCIADALEHHHPEKIVLDPVMVASSGDLLLQEDAISSLRSRLIPMATLITPNLPEALALLDRPRKPVPENPDELIELARGLSALGAGAVLVKGGHQNGEDSTDILIAKDHIEHFTAKRTPTKNTHGTGCSLSSSIASYLAQGEKLISAVGKAKTYISEAIATADQLQIGQGHGPVNHFYHL